MNNIFKKQIEERREEERQRLKANNGERLLTALTDIPVALLKLIGFCIKNALWIGFALIGVSTLLMVIVPEYKDIIINLLSSKL